MSYVLLSKGICMCVYLDSDIPISSSCHLLHFLFTLPFQKILDKHGAINTATGVKAGKWRSDRHLFCGHHLANLKKKKKVSVHSKVMVYFLHSYTVFVDIVYDNGFQVCKARLSLI